jgi:uncharacterized membrane protein YcfT
LNQVQRFRQGVSVGQEAQRGIDRLTWVDAAKGISIVLVVLGHAHSWLAAAGYPTSSPFGINEALANMRLPLFFFASGLFAATLLEGSWRRLFSSRLALLAWVFFIWQFIDIGYSVVVGVVIRGAPVGDIVNEAAWKPFESIVRPMNELWFLWALCLMFIIVKLLWKLPVAVRILVTLAPALIMTGLDPAQEALLQENLKLGWVGLFNYTFVFMLAALLGRPTAARIAAVPPLVATAAALGAGTALLAAPLVNWGVFDIIFIFAGLAFGIALALLAQRIGLLRAIGRNTLPVYVMHTTVLIAVIVALMITDIDLNAIRGAAYWAPVALAVLATATPLAIYAAYRRAGAIGLGLFELPTSFSPRPASPESRPANPANPAARPASPANPASRPANPESRPASPASANMSDDMRDRENA